MSQDTNQERPLYTVRQAAEILQVQRDTVYQLIRRHELPAYRMGERVTRIAHNDLIAYLEAHSTVKVVA